MSMNTRTSIAARNASADAVCAKCNGGYTKIYTTPRPATPDDAATGTELVRLDFSATAFAPAINGTATANPLTPGTASNTGVPGWFRAFASDDSPVFDGDAGPGSNATFDQPGINSGVQVTSAGMTYTAPMQGA